ncbi:MAG: hypothetical protein ACLFPL_04645 [Candidatus Nanoarchaeia archaeon]
MISKIKEEVTSRIGRVIFNFNLIENLVNQILTQYFEVSQEKEGFFKHQFLNTSIINFNSKVKLLKQILEEIGAEEVKHNVKLLEDLNRYRNMFAHCSIEFEHVFSDETHNNNSEQKSSQIMFEPQYIKPTLKYSMNAQGKVSDKEFFEIYEEFKQKTLEIEAYLREVKRMM